MKNSMKPNTAKLRAIYYSLELLGNVFPKAKPSIKNFMIPIYMYALDGRKITDKKRQKVIMLIENMLKVLNLLPFRNALPGQQYNITEWIRVATLVAILVSTLLEALGISPSSSPVIQSWLKRCKNTMPSYTDAQRRALQYFKSTMTFVSNTIKSKL